MQARSSYDQQLAIEAYWRGVDPLTFLPGSINAADRFARVSFLINAIPGKRDPSTIKAVPGATYEKSGGGQRAERHAFHSECRWASPIRPSPTSHLPCGAPPGTQKDMVFWFDSATSPNAFWVP